ncbi:MAG: single-stranded DNA-binding protein [Ignavibacteria bacterium RIFOXYB2_FULL_35_12]|nr:MAG: single-stranded DNA-binding protein [Ignavibacteria bacterium GWA2_36_19]OGU49300.1 MAG: single-stranded DNA-binding protein [Ignavibacteria bacterium GWC2_35_8]OGU57948.1 MAG: single-stranded DNA-binding protein [Ignavibacteria bacterium GWF2_35_20]OGU79496.1 MAG: single-stranded DNA-binding protein [Ignavibacteria bacterium RIFOXYA2_FULL_35_9]OGU90477.1 MAG: single-stranded DNA-binding protein [Ignavibacteria bacterium RIFOXYC12_FULL_35_11]OGU91898.1 MAG: single-stranded DNA-binding 
MAFSLNRIMLIGHLGKDCETRFTTGNVSVTNFTLATTHSYKDKNGNWKDETTWHNVVSFSLSDYMKENLKKGKKFYVEGRLTKRDYTDKDGNKKYFTEVISERLLPLEGTAGSSTEESRASATEATPEITPENNEDLPF